MLIIDELRKVSIFENLKEEEFKILSSFSTLKTYKEGEILFYEKDIPDSLILLIHGALKLYKTNPKGNEIIIHKFFPNSIVAEMPLLESIPYPASAQFEREGSVIKIDFNKFKKEFLSNPDVAFNFFKSLSQKIKALENVIALNIVLDSTSRVAKYICENEGALSMKHSQIAQYLDMTPETLSRIFKKLVTLELIKKSSQTYTITNDAGLRVLFE
jgi:CRP/FNR family transcriptional regulator